MQGTDRALSQGWLNELLRDISPIGSIPVTGRNFRGALATLLARKGAKASQLRCWVGGRLKKYRVYISKGRANNWLEMLDLMSSLTLSQIIILPGSSPVWDNDSLDGTKGYVDAIHRTVLVSSTPTQNNNRPGLQILHSRVC